MNVKSVLGLVAGFAAGVAVGHFCLQTADSANGSQQGASEVSAADDGRALKAANRRIGELERKLASLSARSEKGQDEAERTDESSEEPDDSSVEVAYDGSQTNLYEALAKKLPAEDFRQVTNAFERMKQARMKRARGKVDFLASVDLSGASAADRATHDEYMKLVVRQEELLGKGSGFFPNPGELQDLIELQARAKPLADAERKVLLRQMSANLGYTGEDASVVIGTVEDILGATSGGGLGEALGAITEGIGGGSDGSPIKVQTHVLTL